MYKLKPHKPYARLQETEKKNTSKTIIAQAYQSRCCFWRSSVVAESLETFQPSYASSKGKWVSSFLKTMPSEIGFPMTLTSGAFLNQKRNKQTSHELQKNLDSSCISFCTSSRKRQLKTSQDDTKLCQLQLSVNNFPDAASISAWTHLSNFDQSEHRNWNWIFASKVSLKSKFFKVRLMNTTYFICIKKILSLSLRSF